MERKYKAFISYRRLPLDSRVAKRIQKLIEHYSIPKALRKNKEKRLGYVFRDQDELPATSNLPASIQTALDHSEFLIVVCSPETQKSRWVREEILYFLEHHDRDHVLPVLAEGTPLEAFPPELVEVRSSDGLLIERIEPLAANLVAKNNRKRNQLFGVESLRILAPLIGCSFDELYRREQRYKMRRVGVAVGVFTAIAAVFIGVLLNRNAEIKRQMLNAKINESNALVRASESAFQNGDYRGAVNAVLDALPGRDPERPFVPAAEAVLADELYLYQTGLFRYIQSIEQKSAIDSAFVSAQWNILVTRDNNQVLRTYDIVTGELMWEHRSTSDYLKIKILENQQSILVSSVDSVFALSLTDGTCIWDKTGCALEALSERDDYGLLSRTSSEPEHDEVFYLVDLKNGSIKNSIHFDHEPLFRSSALSQDGQYAAILMETEDVSSLCIFDFEVGTWEVLPEKFFTPFGYADYRLCFTPETDLVLAAHVDYLLEEEGAFSFVCCFDRESGWKSLYRTEFELSSIVSAVNGGYRIFPSVDLLAYNGGQIAFGAWNMLLMLDAERGEILWQKQLPGHIADAKMYSNQFIALVLSNGLVAVCTPEGLLSSEYYLYCFEADFDVYSAAISGNGLSDSIFALVSAQEHQRTSILRYVNNNELTPMLDVQAHPEQFDFYSSPSGKWLAFVKQLDGGGLSVVMEDTEKGFEKHAFQISSEEWLHIEKGNTYVTESGLLISRDLVIDPWAETYSGMSASGEYDYYGHENISCERLSDHAVLTASIERDTAGRNTLLLRENGNIVDTCPFPEEISGTTLKDGYYKLSAIGGNGYVVISTWPSAEKSKPHCLYSANEKAWYYYKDLCQSSGVRLSLADRNPWLAVIGEDDTLDVYDLHKGEQRFSVDCEIPASGVVKLAFANDDQLVLLFSSDASVLLFDTADGTMLCRLDFGDRITSFHESARIACYPVDQQERLLIVYDDPYYTLPACFVLNTRQWEYEGTYAGVTACMPENSLLFIDADIDGFFYTKLLSLDEMMEKAERMLKEGAF